MTQLNFIRGGSIGMEMPRVLTRRPRHRRFVQGLCNGG